MSSMWWRVTARPFSLRCRLFMPRCCGKQSGLTIAWISLPFESVFQPVKLCPLKSSTRGNIDSKAKSSTELARPRCCTFSFRAFPENASQAVVVLLCLVTKLKLWVSPMEVENALLGHPQVAEAAVVGATDERGLSYSVAHVVLRRNIQGSEKLAAEICEHVKARLVSYKVPREVRFCGELPKTVTGKIQRFKLRGA